MTAPRPPTTRSLDQALRKVHFLAEWLASVQQFEKAERDFREITAAYLERHSDPTIAEIKAASDRDRRVAIEDAAYYRDRALMYGMCLLAEMLRSET